jgi:TolB-like protein/DNA-binding winged helix-turn-helix (wHTH) protein/cytochrome c-type biogenesis protein CcmH/NrfG
MSNSRFRFGSFELDGPSSELRKGGLRIHIEDQPFRILEVLVSRPGEVVTREELREAIWGEDTHVDFDRSLTRGVNKVRVALGDSASNPRFLETLPRRGYRFVAPVTRIEQTGTTAEEPPEIRDLPVQSGYSKPLLKQRLSWWALIAAVLTAVIVTSVAMRGKPAKRISSLAVLPLENLSGDPNQGYVSDGITDQLTAVLSRLPSLHVTSFKSAMRYKNTRKTPAEIATELEVDAVVTGSVLQVSGQVRLKAHLIQFPGERSVWKGSYDRNAVELRSLQNELARSIAEQLGATIRPEDESHSTRTIDSQLHDHYVRGRLFASEPGRESLERGIDILEKVIKQDPGHAEAYSATAEAWSYLANVHLDPALAMPKAKAAARKAIDLDPRSDVARAALGRVHLFYDWNWNAAEEQFQKAIDLNPNSSDAHRGMALLRLAMGRNREAVDSVQRAIHLDPRSFRAQLQAVLVLTFAEKYDDAIRQANKTLEWEPTFFPVRSLLGMAYVETGQIDAGIRELEATVRSLRVPTTLGFLAFGYGRAGRKAEAQAILTELVALSKKRYVCPFEVAVAYSALGQFDDSFDWMHKGVAARADCMIYLRSEPWLRPLRSDPRYARLVREIGFVQN